MSNTPANVPAPVNKGTPLRAEQFNGLRAVVEQLLARVAALESVLGVTQGVGGATRKTIVPGFIVGVDSDGTFGGTSYKVRAIGEDDGGDSGWVQPCNRFSDDPAVLCTPAAVDDYCWIERSFDGDAEMVARLFVWTEKATIWLCAG